MSVIEGLKPYPAYRDSGLAWLGQVPAHWQTRRTKVLFRERVEKGFAAEPLLAATQSHGVICKKDYGARTVTAQKDLHLLKLVEPGNFVISLRSFEGGIEIARSRGIISPAYTVLALRSATQGEYFRYLFKSQAFIASLTLFVTGVREGQNIDYERLSRAFMPLPPLDEQAAIVRFLDHATRRLDKAIRAKRKTIALLNEQKQSITHSAVTRGLDPDVPLKAAGITSLKHMPAHWERWPFVRCAIERADYRGATPEKVAVGIFLITAKNVRQGWIDYESSQEYVRRSEYMTIMRRGLPKKDDVLLTMEAPLGHVALIDREDIALAQRLVRFRMSPLRLLPRFALLAMNSRYFQNQLLERATGSTAQGIKASKLPQLLLALPTVEEQARIVSWVDAETAPIENTISRIEREVTLLGEYRTRLIADVVTGQLDVREAAARLPAEDDAPTESIAAADDTDPADALAELEADA